MREYPKSVYSGLWRGGHCQGIAVDKANGYMYFSFTTELVKTDLSGRVLGSAKGLLGHLGCIAFNEADGRVYGSLEYKGDEIGRGIAKRFGDERDATDAFYAAIFDGEAIAEIGMDACESGVMTAAYLAEVVDDYRAALPGGLRHRYGCSGIDGFTFAPAFGAPRDGERSMLVSYGVYADLARLDNDNQVILRYDARAIAESAKPISQRDMHACGPAAPLEKLFLYTGNTTYGVQNMEYDPYTGDVLLAVYPGTKPGFPNKPMYIVDGRAKPEAGELAGLNERGLLLQLKDAGELHAPSGVRGWDFPYGSTGMCALGEGMYYFSHDARESDGWSSTARLYRWDGKAPFVEA